MKTSRRIIFVGTFIVFIFLWCHGYVPIWSSSRLRGKLEKAIPTKAKIPQNKMKYILQWTSPQKVPFLFMERGQRTFYRRNCVFRNCYVTSNRSYLNNIQDFDAILFNGPEMSYNIFRLPIKRSSRQKYVFVSTESSATYPFYYRINDGYFNWTWTYRLSSDIHFRYIIIKNKYGDIIGPKTEMHWLKVEEMKPIDDELKNKLKTKKIAAAWFVSHCNVSNKRDDIARSLQQELAKYNMEVDIYGECGDKKCPRIEMNKCLRMLETDYYFYLSFENTLTEDYVTEKLLYALQHYTVPIVYGGANYTRFMPDGTYLNVQTQELHLLAKKMADIIIDKQKYHDYFRWMNHYSYHYPEDFPESDYYCDFCKKMNDFKLLSRTSCIKNINEWWNRKSERTPFTQGL